MAFYIGCPIWANKSWVGSLFPEGTKARDYLYEYARRLNTVEGNTTFYATPAAETLQRWVEETPRTFRLCPKLPRTVSHAGKLMDHLAEARVFLETMEQLGERLGPLFLQLPPGYPPAWIVDLGDFLANWPPNAQLAVEVRHSAWFDPRHHEALQTLLSEHRAARVIIDTRPIRSLSDERILQESVYLRLLQARARKPQLPIVSERTSAPFVFLRYIGHPRLEQNASFLEEWAGRLAGWLEEGEDAYVFCHCPDESLDPTLCRELYQRVSAITPLPPLPSWEKESSEDEQPRLL